MRQLPPTYTIENFFSEEEINKIFLFIFENQSLWKNASEYPNFLNKKSSFHIHKESIRKILEQIEKFNINLSDSGSIKFFINLIKEYYKKHQFLEDKFFAPYINDEEFLYYVLEKEFKVFNDMQKIDDKILEKIYHGCFSDNIFQNMFGDAIYMLDGEKNFIDWNVQKIIRTEFSWVYDKLIDKFKNIFLEEVQIHSSLPSPGFHIFSVPDQYNQKKIKFQYHKDVNILDYYPYVNTETIYSFVSLIKSPETKPFVEFKDYGKMYYEYKNLYVWRGHLIHRIGEMLLKEGEHRITFQGHLFFDEKEKIIKMFF